MPARVRRSLNRLLRGARPPAWRAPCGAKGDGWCLPRGANADGCGGQRLLMARASPSAALAAAWWPLAAAGWCCMCPLAAGEGQGGCSCSGGCGTPMGVAGCGVPDCAVRLPEAWRGGGMLLLLLQPGVLRRRLCYRGLEGGSETPASREPSHW